MNSEMKDYFSASMRFRAAECCFRAARQGLIAQPVMSEISVFKEMHSEAQTAPVPGMPV
jgi:hypothetical protein